MRSKDHGRWKLVARAGTAPEEAGKCGKKS
jgi:hypothetical protein